MSFVYLIEAGNFHKIGYTSYPDKRMKQLSTLPPFELELVHLICCDDDTQAQYAERRLHHKYRKWRKHGEWFELTRQQVEDICDIQHFDGCHFRKDWPTMNPILNFTAYSFGFVSCLENNNLGANPFALNSNACNSWLAGYSDWLTFSVMYGLRTGREYHAILGANASLRIVEFMAEYDFLPEPTFFIINSLANGIDPPNDKAPSIPIDSVLWVDQYVALAGLEPTALLQHLNEQGCIDREGI